MLWEFLQSKPSPSVGSAWRLCAPQLKEHRNSLSFFSKNDGFQKSAYFLHIRCNEYRKTAGFVVTRGSLQRDIPSRSTGYVLPLTPQVDMQPGRYTAWVCVFSLSGWTWNPIIFSLYCTWISSWLLVMWKLLIECNPWKIYSPDQLSLRKWF